MKLTTWRKLITEEMEDWGDSWKNIVATTLSDAELYDEFPDPEGIVGGKYGLPDLPSYTWTQTRVYFIVTEDIGGGYTSVTSVPRHPCDCEPAVH